MADGRMYLHRWAAVAAAVVILIAGFLIGSVATAKTGMLSGVRVPVMVASASPVRAQDISLATGLSPVVEKIRPVVVNISSTRVVRAQGGPMGPMFNDPMLRQFFGQSAVPREQREHSLGSGVIVNSDGY